MAIKIKELFVTDLDPNSGAWWSKSKIDKINYNFNQFSNGGAPGPRGNIGVDGGDGHVGPQGYVGYRGSQGFQGFQGAGNLNEWDYFPEAEGLPGYLFTRKNPITEIQLAPVALRVGYKISDTGVYGVGVDPAIDSPIQSIKVADNDWVNLRVEDNSGFDGYNFRLGYSGVNPRFEITPNRTSPNFRIIYTAQTIVIRTGTSDGISSVLKDSIIITEDLITVNTGGIIGPAFNLSVNGGTTKSSTDFMFTPGAIQDRILVSTDTSGNVEWKDIKDVFGVFPIGSIISIKNDVFVTEHFWLNDSVTVDTGSPLNNIYGRGKIGTDFEGWYLCNGETWETVEGYNKFLTPNLNNFNYTIGANGDVQNLVTLPAKNPILIGGYDMRVSGIPNNTGVYSIGYTSQFYNNDTSPGESDISMGPLDVPNEGYRISGMIHIVYLGNPNLKWSTTLTTPDTNYTIFLTQPSSNSTSVCGLNVNEPKDWNEFTSSVWNTFTVPSTTYKLFNLGTTTYAPSGWYANVDGYPIYWNSFAGNFTQRGIRCV